MTLYTGMGIGITTQNLVDRRGNWSQLCRVVARVVDVLRFKFIVLNTSDHFLESFESIDVDDSKNVSIRFASEAVVGQGYQLAVIGVEIWRKVFSLHKFVRDVANGSYGQIESINEKSDQSDQKGQKDDEGEKDLADESHLITGLFDVLLEDYISHADVNNDNEDNKDNQSDHIGGLLFVHGAH